MGSGSGTRVAFVRARSASGGAACDPPVDLLAAAGAVRAALGRRAVAAHHLEVFDADAPTGAAAPSGGSAPHASELDEVVGAVRALRPHAIVLGRSSAGSLRPLGAPGADGLLQLGARLRAEDAPTPPGGARPAWRVALLDDDPRAAEALIAGDGADVAVRGDADDTLAALLRALTAPGASPERAARSAGERGLTWRRDDGSIAHGARGSRPLRPATPAWDLLDLTPYGRAPGDGVIARLRRRIGLEPAPSAIASVRTTRACVPDCPTCRGSFGASGPERPVREVLAEIRQLVTTRDVRELRILDHAFDGRPGRAAEIARGIARLKSAPALKNLSVEFPAGFRGDGLDDELVDALLELGLRRFDVHVATAAERLQRLFKRNVHLGRTRDALERIERRGAVGRVSIALGLPTETTGEAAHTIQWAARSAARELVLENGREAPWARVLALGGRDDVDDFVALRRRARRAFFTDPRRGATRLVRAGAAHSRWAARLWTGAPAPARRIAAQRAVEPAAS